jgi:hypothetical protein
MPIALPIALAVGAAASVGSAVIGAKAASKAAKTQAAAADRATKVQLEAQQQQREDLSPYAMTGKGAMSSIANLYGLPTEANPNGGQAYSEEAISAFKRAPDYQVAYKAGVDGINSADAGNRSLLSGAHMKRLVEHAGNMADSRFNTYLSRLFSLAGMGQNAAASQGAGALNTGNNIANNTIRSGDAAASGIVGQANQISGAIGGVANNLGYYAMRGAYDTPSSIYDGI